MALLRGRVNGNMRHDQGTLTVHKIRVNMVSDVVRTGTPADKRRGAIGAAAIRLQSCRSNCLAPTGIVTPPILRETHIWIAVARSTGSSSEPALTETTAARSI